MRKATPRKSAVKKAAKKSTLRRRIKAWSATEVSMLRGSYKSMTTSQIARRLKRTLASVQTKVRTLGLSKGHPKKSAVRKAAPKRMLKAAGKKHVGKAKAVRKPVRRGRR
jgi:hypothetical protein